MSLISFSVVLRFVSILKFVIYQICSLYDKLIMFKVSLPYFFYSYSLNIFLSPFKRSDFLHSRIRRFQVGVYLLSLFFLVSKCRRSMTLVFFWEKFSKVPFTPLLLRQCFLVLSVTALQRGGTSELLLLVWKFWTPLDKV